jgi:hypothetical protein
MRETITIELEQAKAVFDIAVESMDFGSGFLIDEDVEYLRAFAVAIGVDPWIATPEHHRPKYCPGHNWSKWTERNPSFVLYPHLGADAHPSDRTRRCSICGLHENEKWDVVHQRWIRR